MVIGAPAANCSPGTPKEIIQPYVPCRITIGIHDHGRFRSQYMSSLQRITVENLSSLWSHTELVHHHCVNLDYRCGGHTVSDDPGPPVSRREEVRGWSWVDVRAHAPTGRAKWWRVVTDTTGQTFHHCRKVDQGGRRRESRKLRSSHSVYYCATGSDLSLRGTSRSRIKSHVLAPGFAFLEVTFLIPTTHRRDDGTLLLEEGLFFGFG